MVEYLSGSTQSSWLVVNPVLFFAFLAQNFGSYGLAVILIREAMVPGLAAVDPFEPSEADTSA